jgi:two-component system cell cycle sensor histidine kinase PleC
MTSKYSINQNVEIEALQDFAGLNADWYWEQDAELRLTRHLSLGQFPEGLNPDLYAGMTRRQTNPTGVSEEAWARHDAALAARRELVDFRFSRILPDGRVRWFSLGGKPFWSSDGTFMGYRGIGRDITDLVALETDNQGARQQVERVMRAFELSAEAIALWDKDEKLVFCNQAYRDQAQRLQHKLQPGYEFGLWLKDSLDFGEIDTGELTSEEWLAIRLSAFRDRQTFEGQRMGRWLLIRHHETPDGGTLLACTDITELKEQQRDLIAAQRAAEAANRAKSAFLAHMSHELRTPLNAIMGYSEIIRDQLFGPDSPRYSQYAGFVHQGGSYLLSLIETILDLAKIEAETYELNAEHFPVTEALDVAITTLRPAADRQGVSLTAIATISGNILAERRGLMQILINLLSNAIKFSSKGGSIRLLAELTDKGELSIRVEDTGVGMTEEEIEHAFEPFRRGNPTLSRDVEGAGLGLAISQRIAVLHGGSISITSTPGLGSTVTLVLPQTRCRELTRL